PKRMMPRSASRTCRTTTRVARSDGCGRGRRSVSCRCRGCETKKDLSDSATASGVLDGFTRGIQRINAFDWLTQHTASSEGKEFVDHRRTLFVSRPLSARGNPESAEAQVFENQQPVGNAQRLTTH